jgi:hypothetical protein
MAHYSIMRDKNQVLMFSDGELELIKHTFADNDELLYAIRNVLLQFPLTKEEKEALKAQITPEVYAVLKKKLLPEISPDAPLTQLADLRQTLTNDLKTKTVEEMAPLFDAKRIVLSYLEQQMFTLTTTDFVPVAKTAEVTIALSELAVLTADPYTNFVNTTARNFILGFVDPMLRDFLVLAGRKDDSVGKTKLDLIRNSSK